MREIKTIDGIEFENFSLDGEVGFIEPTHQYKLMNNPDFKFNSVTTLLKQYEEHFDMEGTAIKCSKNKNNKEYYGRDPQEIMEEWREKGRVASEMGTRLHNYGEDLLNKVEKPADIPDSPKTKWVDLAVQELWDNGYELAITELLVYSEELALAGQSDILLKKNIGGETYYQIYDWKFLNKPIQKKSYYNRFKRTYKKMSGPFKHLMDCNWIHYSIQLAIYQTLSGDPGRVTEKVLVVVQDGGYDFVPCYPMRVFWDHNNELQAVYEVWNGKWYDSRTDALYKRKPADIVGL